MSSASRPNPNAVAHANSRVGNCISSTNIVATCDFGRVLPLTLLAIAIGGRTDNSVFPACVSCNGALGTVNSVFATGKCVLVGCASENHALLAAHMLAKLIWDTMRISVTVLNFRIRNIVCRVELEASAVHPPSREPRAESGSVQPVSPTLCRCGAVCVRVAAQYSLPPPKEPGEPMPPASEGGGVNMEMLYSDIKARPDTHKLDGFNS